MALEVLRILYEPTVWERVARDIYESVWVVVMKRKMRVLKREWCKLGKYWDDEIYFPVDFCPVCGSTTITSSSTFDPLLGTKDKTRTDMSCWTCGFSCVIHPYRRGTRKFRVRVDDKDKPDWL